MEIDHIQSQILAEVLRLQRWASGLSQYDAKTYGLLHGFESVQHEQLASPSVSEDMQEKVEDVLQDIEDGKQSVEHFSLSGRFAQEKIDKSTVLKVMTLCLLQSRFLDAIEKISKAKGSQFANVKRYKPPELGWFGNLHYVELVDITDEEKINQWAVFSANIPRVGEVVQPERGELMKVVSVRYYASTEDEPHTNQTILIPHVFLRPYDDDDDDGFEFEYSPPEGWGQLKPIPAM